MKKALLLLLIILTSCKKETTTQMTSNTNTESNSENKIDQSVLIMWDAFVASNPEFKNKPLPDVDFFHDNKSDANRLAALTKNGVKQASSGLNSLYRHYNVPLPKAGNTKIITDFNGIAQAIIKTIRVDTIPFNAVSKTYATLDMGTTLEPLKKWRKAHWNFFTKIMTEHNQNPTEDMLVVCEQFKTIWPKKQN